MSEGNQNKKVTAGAIVVLALLIAGFIYVKKNAPPTLPSIAEVRGSLLSQSTISFGVPEGAVDIALADLPSSIQAVVPSGAEALRVMRLEGGSSPESYKIRYEVGENLHTHFLNIREGLINGSWQILLGNRSDLIDIIEVENDLHQVRVEITFVTEEEVSSRNVERISAASKRSSVTILVKGK